MSTIRLIVFATILTVGLVPSALANWESLELHPELVTADGLKARLQLGEARAAAVGLFDGDGVLDLCAAYATDAGGALVVFMGRAEFRQGLRRDLWRAEQGLSPELPFDPRATVHALPFAPDWIGIGDFDADGHQDVLGAASGVSELILLAGDGSGSLAAPRRLELPGAVTACSMGEVNKSDGVADVVVAIETGAGSSLLVFEHPEGIFKAEPEWYSLARPVTDLALVRLDRDPWIDIAAADGQVTLVLGRDRRLSGSRLAQERVGAAEVRVVDLESPAVEIEAGRFVEGSNRQLAVRCSNGEVVLVRSADRSLVETERLGRLDVPSSEGRLLAAATSGHATHDLVLAHGHEGVRVLGLAGLVKGSRRLEVRGAVEGREAVVVAARLNKDARDDLVLLGGGGTVRVAATSPRAVFEVNSTNDLDDGTCSPSPGHCSLREAINAVNISSADSSIVMDLGVGATISPTSELPAVTGSGAIIDGTVGSAPLVSWLELDGSSCSGGCNGLTLDGFGASVSTLVIGGFSTSKSAGRSVLSGAGISITSDDNVIEKCLLGVDLNSNSIPNEYGVVIEASDDNTIGATVNADRNIISGNDSHGVYLWGADGASFGTGNVILGNYIGTNRYATAGVGNGNSGVNIELAGANEVGGFGSEARNIIADNGAYGVGFWRPAGDDASGAFVRNNLIGCGADGVTALPNGNGGIRVYNHRNTTVGGTIPGRRNVLAGAVAQKAIHVAADSAGSVVMGNYVSLGSDGDTARPYSVGISVDSNNVTVGGTTAGAGNLVGENSHYGINAGSTGIPVSWVEIYGNVVGTDADQTSALQNGLAAVRLSHCTNCWVGEYDTSGSSNVIVATASQAPGLLVEACNTVSISENRIGVRSSGDLMPNGSHGILVEDTNGCNIVKNVIAYNSLAGVAVTGSSQEVFVRANSIHSNILLGVDLGAINVTPNDAGDGDTGPNNLQNFPVITGYDPDTDVLTATLDTDQASTVFGIDIYESSACDGSGYGEGETYLGTRNVSTNGVGDASLSATIAVSAGKYLTLIASDPDGNSSEFSACHYVQDLTGLIFADGFESGDTTKW